jgi:tetratricopeptide (TPR) repeat protein
MDREELAYEQFLLGTERLMASDHEQALTYFQSSLDLHPHYKTCQRVAQILVVLGKPHQAEPFIEQAYALNPNHSQTGTDFAKLLIQRGDIVRAKELLQQVVNHNKTYSPANEVLAQLNR